MGDLHVNGDDATHSHSALFLVTQYDKMTYKMQYLIIRIPLTSGSAMSSDFMIN